MYLWLHPLYLYVTITNVTVEIFVLLSFSVENLKYVFWECVYICAFVHFLVQLESCSCGIVIFLFWKTVLMQVKGWWRLCYSCFQLIRKIPPFVCCSVSHSYSLEINGVRSANTDDSAAGMPDSFSGFSFEPAYWFYLLLGVTVIEFNRWRGKVLNLRTQMESRLQKEDYSRV